MESDSGDSGNFAKKNDAVIQSDELGLPSLCSVLVITNFEGLTMEPVEKLV